MVGLTKNDMLQKELQGNTKGMENTIEKGNTVAQNGFYYRKTDIHEHITGGKKTFQFDGGDHRNMSQADIDKTMGLLNHAPRAAWGAQQIDWVQAMAIAMLGVPAGAQAMARAQESLDALQAVCAQMKAFYRKCKNKNTLES